MATMIDEVTDIKEAMAIEAEQPPGIYEIRLSIITPLTQGELDDFHQLLLDHGVDIRGCLQQRLRGLYQIRIKYAKHPPTESIAWVQAVLALIPLAIIGTLVGIGIFKIGDLSKALMPILLVGGGLAIAILALARGPAEKVAQAYMGSRYG